MKIAAGQARTDPPRPSLPRDRLDTDAYLRFATTEQASRYDLRASSSSPSAVFSVPGEDERKASKVTGSVDRSTALDRVEALLAVVYWGAVVGGRPGNHTGPMTDVPEMVRDLWHPSSGRRWDAVDFLEMAGFEYGVTRPATERLVPVLVAALADLRSAESSCSVWLITTTSG